MSDLGVAYAMKKRSKKEGPGDVVPKVESQIQPEEVEDVVERIMKKRMSQGGMVANAPGVSADEMPNNFDDLSLRDELEFSYTGENSGDEIGNAQKDDDDEDIVSRVMKSRSKKDRMPNPA